MFTGSISFVTFVALFLGMMVLGRWFTSKFKRLKYIIPLLGALFFLVNAFIDKEMLYPSLFFFLIFGSEGIRNLMLKRKKREKKNEEKGTA